jgi:Arc/MetJ-type ribon-helix-helix transcriptional regulator
MKTSTKRTSLKLQQTVYLDDLSVNYISDLVAEKYYRSPSECIRDLITRHRMRQDPAVERAEEKINATMQGISKRHTRDIRRLQLTCDSLDAMVQVLTRMLLLNIPEPSADVKAALRATSEGRYNNLLKLAHKQYETHISERKERESMAE